MKNFSFYVCVFFLNLIYYYELKFRFEYKKKRSSAVFILKAYFLLYCHEVEESLVYTF